MQAKYINKSRHGLKNGHEYVLNIKEPRGHYYAYDVNIIYDITEEEDLDIIINYASEISIRRNFQFDKLEFC